MHAHTRAHTCSHKYTAVFCPKYGMWQCAVLLWFCPPWAGACSSAVKRTSTGSPKGFWMSSTCGQLDGSALASLTQRTHMTSGELCHGESLNTQCMGLNRERRLFLPPPPFFFNLALFYFQILKQNTVWGHRGLLVGLQGAISFWFHNCERCILNDKFKCVLESWLFLKAQYARFSCI